MRSQFVTSSRLSMVKAKRNIIQLIPDERIVNKIYIIRDQKVMLDFDLAELYQVETCYLKRQVKRNIERFPEDFMFELLPQEFKNLRSQFGTSSWGGTRYSPMAFTEQGVAMLSGVVNSEKSIAMNIAIMRAFVEMRRIITSNKKIADQIKTLFERIDVYDVNSTVFMKQLKTYWTTKLIRHCRKKIGRTEKE